MNHMPCESVHTISQDIAALRCLSLQRKPITALCTPWPCNHEKPVVVLNPSSARAELDLHAEGLASLEEADSQEQTMLVGQYAWVSCFSSLMMFRVIFRTRVEVRRRVFPIQSRSLLAVILEAVVVGKHRCLQHLSQGSCLSWAFQELV